MTVFIITRLTFREASRRWVLWVALLLGILFLLIFSAGLNEIEKDIIRQSGGLDTLVAEQFHSFLLMAGLYVVNFLTTIMAVLTSVDTVSGEINSGTIQTLVSKPVKRWEILMGKWVGLLVMLTIYLLMMAGGVLLIIYLRTGYLPSHVPDALVFLWMNICVLLGVSFFGGSLFSTLANGVMVFGLYGIAFIGGWIEQFGSILSNQAAINVGVVSSLLLPSEALWKRAAYEIQSPLVAAMGVNPFSSLSVPSLLMIIYAALYAVGSLGLALWIFSKRDI
jgi:Cu-processing system permease protein